MFKQLYDWVSGATAREARQQALALAQAEQEHKVAVINKLVNAGRQLCMICGPVNVDLHDSENLACVLPNTGLYEPRSVRVYQGGSAGTSIRVAKGLSFRVGGSRGYAEYHDELRPIDQGDFIITSKRLIFCGSARTVSINFEDIVSSTPCSDGLRINKERRDKPYIFAFDRSLNTVIEGVKFNASGEFIDGILDQAKVLSHCPNGMGLEEFMHSHVKVSVQTA
jgi:hypothetical protein